jgi:tetratricopeptide (TPR) repeat protein
MFCPDAKMSAVLATMNKDPGRALNDIEKLLGEHPRDPRLHFLKGSLLASNEDYVAARAAIRRAVDIAPDFAVARFQLGFLHLTSAEPHAAQEAWGPLHGLPEDNYIRLFVTGLCHLIRDEFPETIRCLEDGIRRNTENPPMNRDMQLIIDDVRRKPSKLAIKPAATSSVEFLLQQSAFKKPTKH